MTDTNDAAPTNGTELADVARALYEQNRNGEGRPWEHTNAATREKWQVRAAKAAANHAVELAKPKPPGTRKYRLGGVPLDFSQQHEALVQLPAGAVVRGAVWAPKEQRIALQQATPSFQLLLIVEVDPDAQLEPRRFVQLVADGALETHHQLTFVAFSLEPPHMRPLCLYELRQAIETSSQLRERMGLPEPELTPDMLMTPFLEEPNE